MQPSGREMILFTTLEETEVQKGEGQVKKPVLSLISSECFLKYAVKVSFLHHFKLDRAQYVELGD